MTRALAPARLRSSRKTGRCGLPEEMQGSAAQASGSKLPRHRWFVSNRISSPTQPPVGASLLAMKSTRFQTKTSHPHRRQTPLLQNLPTHLHQATHPCAFAYNYARIRPLVRLVPGFYCLPATAHQWSGLVARGNRSCTSASQTGPDPVLDGGCMQGAQARRLLRFPGLLTCVQLPPHCLVASGCRHHIWNRSLCSK